MTTRIKPTLKNPKLDELLAWAKQYVEDMPEEDKEKMLKEQAKSWARQDKD